MKIGVEIKQVLPISLFLALLISSVGCDPSTGGQSTAAEGSSKGTITVSGAWALYPLMVRWGEKYQELNPGVRVDVSAGGAGKGMADALANAVDIGMVSREIYPEEAEKGAIWISVTKDAVFPTINQANPVWEDLSEMGATRDTLIGIYLTGEITTWGQVVGRPEVEDPIHIFTRSDACGAAATWAKYLGAAQEDLLGIAVYGDPGLLDAVIKDPLAIGFNNLNYAFDMETGMPVAGARAMPVDIDGDGQTEWEEIFDTKELAVSAVAMGRYPSPPARDLNLVTLGQPSGLVRGFIEWVLTDGQDYVGEAGYIALPKERLGEELGKLD